MVKGGNRLDDFKKGVGKGAQYITDDVFKKNKYDGYELTKDGDIVMKDGKPLKKLNYKNLVGPNLKDGELPARYNTYKGEGIRFKTVLVLFLLAIFYVILAIVAAEIYNQSGNKMKDDTMNQNSYTYIITSMTVAITIVITLLLGAIADKYRLALFLLIFGIFGTATCGIGIQWLNNSDTLSEKYVKGRKIFMGVGIGFWILVFFSGIFTAFSN